MFVTKRRPPVRDPALRTLRRKLMAMSLQTELLSELMGFGHFAQIAMTRDGLLIGRLHGEAGFDVFIGPVTPAIRHRTQRLWQELDIAQQQMVLERLAQQGIDPARVGIAASEHLYLTNGGIRL